MSAPRRNSARSSGIALVVVLWMLALLAVLVLGFVRDTRTELQIARNQDAAARARAIADAGVTLAILGVLDPAPATRWRADGQIHSLRFDGGTIDVGVQDEGGKIDLNGTTPQVLDGLFRVVGLPGDQADQLAQAVITWREAHRTAPAQDATLADSPPPATLQKPFLAIDELRLVPGITAALYDRVAPFVTVYGNGAQVNPMTAPTAVLESLPGADPATIAAFVAARDTQPEAAPGGLPPLPGVADAAVAPLEVFAVTSAGTTAGGARFVRQAVAQIVGAGAVTVQFLSWRQAQHAAAPAKP